MNELTVHDVEKIKEKLAELKQDMAETEGAVKQIKAQWKADHGKTTVEEMEELKEESETSIRNLVQKRTGLVQKLRSIIPEEILDELIED